LSLPQVTENQGVIIDSPNLECLDETGDV